MAIYYVVHNGPQGTGSGDSVANGMDLQTAANTAVSGDEVRVCATGVYVLSATVLFNVNSGTLAVPIRFRSANAQGIVDGTRCTVTTESTLATGLFRIDNAIKYCLFEGFFLDGAGSGKAARCLGNDTDGANYHQWINCRFTNSDAHGVTFRGTGWRFFGCEFDHNGRGTTGDGFYVDPNRGTDAHFIGCSFHHNQRRGAGGRDIQTYHGCVAYRNGSYGFFMDAYGERSGYYRCLAYANGGHGFYLAAVAMSYLVGCSSVGNTGHGFNLSGYDPENYDLFVGHNHAHGNNLGATDVNGGVLYGPGNCGGDPLFYATTDGAEDFRLRFGSPLLGAGPGGTDIGPFSAVPDRFVGLGLACGVGG